MRTSCQILATAAFLSLTACAVKPPIAPAQAPTASHSAETALQREWMLVEIAGFSREQLVKLKAKLDLTRLPQANAYMGCNQMGFEVRPQDQRFVAGMPMSTKMGCEDMLLESAFHQRLETIRTYRLDGQHLILGDGQKDVMRFVASDWD